MMTIFATINDIDAPAPLKDGRKSDSLSYKKGTFRIGGPLSSPPAEV